MQLEILLPSQQADLLDMNAIAFTAPTSNLQLFLALFLGNKCYTVEIPRLNVQFISYFVLMSNLGRTKASSEGNLFTV